MPKPSEAAQQTLPRPQVPACPATYTLPGGLVLVCRWHAGHPADGSHAFAFHAAGLPGRLVVWRDGEGG